MSVLKDKKTRILDIELTPIKEAIPKIEALIKMNDYLKDSFYWKENKSEFWQRREREKQLKINRFAYELNGDKYDCELYVKQTKTKTYVYRKYYKNQKKVYITTIKNSYKELCSLYGLEINKFIESKNSKQGELNER